MHPWRPGLIVDKRKIDIFWGSDVIQLCSIYIFQVTVIDCIESRKTSSIHDIKDSRLGKNENSLPRPPKISMLAPGTGNDKVRSRRSNIKYSIDGTKAGHFQSMCQNLLTLTRDPYHLKACSHNARLHWIWENIFQLYSNIYIWYKMESRVYTLKMFTDTIFPNA